MESYSCSSAPSMTDHLLRTKEQILVLKVKDLHFIDFKDAIKNSVLPRRDGTYIPIETGTRLWILEWNVGFGYSCKGKVRRYWVRLIIVILALPFLYWTEFIVYKLSFTRYSLLTLISQEYSGTFLSWISTLRSGSSVNSRNHW